MKRKTQLLILIPLLIICIDILIYSVVSYTEMTTAEAVISEDYETIVYQNKVYRAWLGDTSKLPSFSDELINATVENRCFLWDSFLTDYVFVSEDGQYLHLITDYDENPSSYFKNID